MRKEIVAGSQPTVFVGLFYKKISDDGEIVKNNHN
jgi:hypothetical protein